MNGPRQVYLLTGTPITNRPRDLFNLLRCVGHPSARSFISFAKQYCDAYKNDYGWVTTEASNLEELNLLMKEVMLRRKKDEVLDLPPKIRSWVPLALGCSAAQAQYTDGTIRIGILNDMSGTYSDLSGRGSLIATRMAVEDFGAAAKGMKVEIVGADHQNKPDVGSNIVRRWIDTGKVDVIVDVPTSSVALAVNEIVRDKNKVFLVSGGATSDLTGAKCTPNTIHWTYDTWALANGTGQAIVKTGGDTWFFLTANYAFGRARP